MNNEEPLIPVTRKRLDELIRKEKLLDALEAHGVDNWEWYDNAYNDAFPEEGI